LATTRINPPEHGCELLRHALEHLLHCGGVTDEGSCRKEAAEQQKVLAYCLTNQSNDDELEACLYSL
jgi:hypothetical protein